MKPEYKNIRFVNGQKKYFLGWQMKHELEEITYEEYKKSKLPVLKYTEK